MHFNGGAVRHRDRPVTRQGHSPTLVCPIVDAKSIYGR